MGEPNLFLLFVSSVIFVSCLITCTQPLCFYNGTIITDYLPTFVLSTAQWIVDVLPFDKVLLMTVSQFALAFYLAYFGMSIVSRLLGTVQWIVGIVLAYSMVLLLVGMFGFGDGLKDQLVGYIRMFLSYCLQHNYLELPLDTQF